MDWIEFTGKNFLAWAILTIQLLSVRAINRMINEIKGLRPLERVNRETKFVFFFFTIQATFDCGLMLALETYSKETTDRYTPKKGFLETIYCILAILYLASYVIFIIILQSYWSHTHQVKYICPILEVEVPFVVYAKNRELARDRHDMSSQMKVDNYF